MKKLDNEEMLKIAQRLENYHSVFYQLFEMGNPVFTNSIPTACVKFDEYGSNVGFEISPKFWKTLHGEQKPFVVAHETLHVLLSHGMRMVNTKNAQACNIAMDVVVNELLVNKFGFNRVEVDPKNNYIWRNKIFPKGTVKKSQSFEYYYNHLKSLAASSSGKKKMKGFGSTVDDHSKMKSGELPKDIAKRLGRKLSKEEKKSLREALKDHLNKETKDKYGKSSTVFYEVMEDVPTAPKNTWEKVIRRWTHPAINENINEQWIRTNRRYADMSSAIFLPSEMEDQEHIDFSRINIYLFLDTSGSCKPLVPRFWKAYNTIPKNKFNIKCFCFSNAVYDVDPKDRKLRGFSGTEFPEIERKIQLLIKQGEKYPDVVFIFSDGEGPKVHPQKPQNWHWFLGPPQNSKEVLAQFGYYTREEAIPKTCHTYDLADFE